MSVEVFLFIAFGALAVFSAIGMLLQQNAVHSALFLIVNLVCVAFLYLMLDAPFLAMIQIAVYAGAILVLFLFVIMLLGAEQVIGEEIRQFKWLAPLALTAALSFLIAVSMAVLSGQIDSRELPPPDPMLRLVHAAPDYPEAVDVYLNGELAAFDVEFQEATNFATVEPGEYSVSVALSGSEPGSAIPLAQPVTVGESEVVSAIIYGEGRLPLVGQVTQDLSTIIREQGRVTFFNAYIDAPAVSAVDPGADGIVEEGEEVNFFVESIAFGEASETLTLHAGDNGTLLFTPEGNFDVALVRNSEFEVERATSEVIIVGNEPDPIEGEGYVPITIPLSTATDPQFGGPTALGQELFTRYVLPFQMVAMLLLAAMVGAIVLTQRTGEVAPKPGRRTRRKVSRPLTSVIAAQTGHDVMIESDEQPKLGASEEDQPEPAGD